MADLTNKIAIVSGGATMIGWKAAQALRDCGAKVVLADIADEEGERAAEELGPDVVFQHTDITDDEQIDACIAATVERFGGIDCLINVACTYLDNGIDSTRDEWSRSCCSLPRKICRNFWRRRRRNLRSRAASSMALAIPPTISPGGMTRKRQIN